MKVILIPTLLLLALAACNSESSYKRAENAPDAGREFIRASLDGNYDRVKFYLLPDSTNQLMVDKWKKDYDNLQPDIKQKYKDADILPIAITKLNDSTTTYKYANSYKKDTSTIKIVKLNGEWLIDLKEILKK